MSDDAEMPKVVDEYGVAWLVIPPCTSHYASTIRLGEIVAVSVVEYENSDVVEYENSDDGPYTRIDAGACVLGTCAEWYEHISMLVRRGW